MHLFARVALVVAGIALLPLPRAAGAGASGIPLLSTSDRAVGVSISRLAARSPARAVRWAERQPGVASAQLGPDGATLAIGFRDGAQLVVLPRINASPARSVLPAVGQRAAPLAAPADTPTPTSTPAATGTPVATSTSTPAKAAVLLPFQDELNEGTNAGQSVIDSLTHAGFQVDVFRNGQVTPDVMATLGQYSVVYIETHSGAFADGDAIVNTASTDASRYLSYIKDGTVRQALSAGSSALYLAITSAFVQKHMNAFPNSSIVYLDGCDLLGATLFWGALQAKNVDDMITWDAHVFSLYSEQTAPFMFGRLNDGNTVQAALAATKTAGLADALGDTGPAHLGYDGDPANTLPAALTRAQPKPQVTDTPTPTSTSLPTATPTPKPVKKHRHKKKHKKKVRLTPTPTRTPVKHKVKKCKTGHHRVRGKCVPNRKPHRV